MKKSVQVANIVTYMKAEIEAVYNAIDTEVKRARATYAERKAEHNPLEKSEIAAISTTIANMHLKAAHMEARLEKLREANETMLEALLKSVIEPSPPPRTADLLLYWVLPVKDIDEVLGDLEECCDEVYRINLNSFLSIMNYISPLHKY